jgi:hypothetical protein
VEGGASGFIPGGLERGSVGGDEEREEERVASFRRRASDEKRRHSSSSFSASVSNAFSFCYLRAPSSSFGFLGLSASSSSSVCREIRVFCASQTFSSPFSYFYLELVFRICTVYPFTIIPVVPFFFCFFF